MSDGPPATKRLSTLRTLSGASLAHCKQALADTHDDVARAIDLIFERRQATRMRPHQGTIHAALAQLAPAPMTASGLAPAVEKQLARPPPPSSPSMR
jgi:hypothetical protein